MEVDDDALVERIAGRFACAYCGEGYHDLYKLPKVKGVCDAAAAPGSCGARTTMRTWYGAAEGLSRPTEPLIDYYRRQGKVSTVDGMADISAVAKEIDQALAGQGAKGVKNRAKTHG